MIHHSPRPLLRVVRLIRPEGARLVAAAAAGAATIACSIGLLATSGWLLARASQGPRIAAVAIAIATVRALGTARGFLRYGERLVSHDTALRVTAALRGAVYERLSVMAPAGLETDRSGDLLHRLAVDVAAMEDLYLRGLNPLLVAAVTSAGAALAAGLILPVAGVIVAAALVVGGVFVPAAAAAGGMRATSALADRRGGLAAEVVDTVGGAAELAAYGAVDDHLAAIRRQERHVARLERREAHLAAIGGSSVTFVAGLAIVSVLAVSLRAAEDGRLSRVAVALLGLLVLAAFEAVQPLPAAWSKLGVLRASAARLADVLDRPPAVTEPAQARPVGGGPHAVEVIGARLSYDGGHTWALDGVDVTLTPGRCVALTGPSGAGKTTLASVLVRFRDLTHGTVLLDGHDLRSYRGDDVRHVIGLVEQRPHLFHTTIRNNLLLARPEATDQELAEAGRQAGLIPWIASLPDGWDTDVGEAGGLVSGGERRRIALARAFLADFPVLILDEPTSDVDHATAAWIMTDVLHDARNAGRAILLITHDTDLIDDVDEVLTMDRGRRVTGTSSMP